MENNEKMKVSAVICELNPLHFGHQALFSAAEEDCDALVCVMSGNFVQRGEPAILDKWARTRLALEAGADLVLELPLPLATAGAERFAAGGVCLAEALGCVDRLIFGSECTDLELLQRIAKALLSQEFSQRLSVLPDTGEPFARRRELVIGAMLGEEAAVPMRSPNAVLAIEYLKALQRQNSAIRPVVFPRLGAAHDRNARAEETLSAGELRARVRAGEDLTGMAPEATLTLLEEEMELGRCPADIAHLERAILAKLRAMTPLDFSHLPDLSEGLENRLAAAARSAHDLEELYGLVKSKRYSHARIRRLVLHAFLGVSRDLPPAPLYLRVLGMNDAGERLLHQVEPALPLLTRPAEWKEREDEAARLLELEVQADDLYSLSCPVPQPSGRDYSERLIRM